MMCVRLNVVIASMMLVTGCATKNYGRVTYLSGTERVEYTCREFDIEIAKVEAFRMQVADGAHTNFASVVGFLRDYGIGNTMEKNGADRSATIRMNQLLDGRAAHGCTRTSQADIDRMQSLTPQHQPASYQEGAVNRTIGLRPNASGIIDIPSH